MKKLITICAVTGVVFGMIVPASATVVTITFDPNDLIDLYPASAGADVAGGRKVDQANARRIHDMWGNPYYDTFYNPAAAHTQPDDYNTYRNWRDGLTGESEGIATFNNWFLGWSGAATWGETWVAKTDAAVSATTPVGSGWSWREIREPYRVEEGAAIQFWTTDSSKYIRNGGADLGNFTITVDLYEDTNANGMWDINDVGVSINDTIRMWMGCINGDDAPFYRADTQALYFDDVGWGSLTPAASPFSSTAATGANTPTATGFEAMLSVTAVPEPATLGLLVMGGVALLRRKRA